MGNVKVKNIGLGICPVLLFLCVSCFTSRPVYSVEDNASIRDFSSDDVIIAGSVDSLIKSYGMPNSTYRGKIHFILYENIEFEVFNYFYSPEVMYGFNGTVQQVEYGRVLSKYTYRVFNDSVQLRDIDFGRKIESPTIMWKGIPFNNKMTIRKFRKLFNVKKSEFYDDDWLNVVGLDTYSKSVLFVVYGERKKENGFRDMFEVFTFYFGSDGHLRLMQIGFTPNDMQRIRNSGDEPHF